MLCSPVRRAALLVLALCLSGAAAWAALIHAPAASAAAQCSDAAYPATRDPANPLLLSPAPPASDPLRGANLWVAGPSHGVAAGAIVHLLGIDTDQQLNTGQPLRGFPESESWSTFADWLKGQLPQHPKSVRDQVAEVEKTAAQPAAIRISSSSGGGSPAAITGQINKFFCTLLPEDPGSTLELSTYFLQPELGGRSSAARIDADAPRFKSQVDAVAAAIGRRPVIILAEEDAVGASSGMVHSGGLHAWESLLKYEVTKFESLPHTAVYLEGGYSDSQTAAYAAKVLNASGVRQIQGFFTNDTHFQWDTNELKYAETVSRATGGAHFIVNTADNGRGPLLNKHPTTQGIEVLCNPPGRGLGIRPTTTPSLPAKYAHYPLDAFLWTYTPGFSVGRCNGGPASGFWTALSVSLGKHANSQLGPGYKSEPW